MEIIANTFGTNILQQNSTRVSNSNGKSNVDFLSISSSDVKGEWIETIGEPQYIINYEQGMLIVTCKVKGTIREITTAAIDLKAKVLRNGTEDRFESSEFRSGDDLYLSFQSPVDGYLAVYLLDEEGNAFCLLPYRNQSDGIYKIHANTPYIFFSVKDAPLQERSLIDEYVMTCEKAQEVNYVYTIFSPNPFIKSIDKDNGEALPRETDGESFQKWLAKVRRKDNSVNFSSKQITITKE
ncbi:MAG: DUF4384 domain-containing protein [Bacteroidaceae bacterium]|nr:DUF4384 domain-containing protein [Bacteroidaceae bacterium]